MNKFKRKQLVRHVKTGELYRIVYTPTYCRLEANNEPAYAYRHATERNAPMWIRGQSEMEDGRFES